MANFVIDSEQKLKEKMELIQNLLDIKIASDIVKDTKKLNKDQIMDENYAKLKCEVKTLGPDSKERKMLSTYLDNTKNHYNLRLLEAFKLEREGEEKGYNPKNLGNKMLLWHGSRFSNFGGILS